MKVTSSLLLALITLLSCTPKPMDTGSTPADTKTGTLSQQVTYLALGDSYTIGESVSAPESYPYQLADQLRQSKFNVADPVIIAQTGWTTANLKRAITEARLTQKFSFVTLLIGVNNQYQNLSADAYRKEFDELVNTAVSFAGSNKKKVFIISIPDWAVTPFASGRDRTDISKQIDLFNQINKAESEKLGVNYLNITDISREATTDPELVAPDGLHPSGKMYTLWVQRLLPQILNSFK